MEKNWFSDNEEARKYRDYMYHIKNTSLEVLISEIGEEFQIKNNNEVHIDIYEKIKSCTDLKKEIDIIPEELFDRYVELRYKEAVLNGKINEIAKKVELDRDTIESISTLGEHRALKEKIKQSLKQYEHHIPLLIGLGIPGVWLLMGMIQESPTGFTHMALVSIAFALFYVVGAPVQEWFEQVKENKWLAQSLKQCGLYDILMEKRNIDKELNQIKYSESKPFTIINPIPANKYGKGGK